ncbi:ABC transporter ATP-binding protein [Armatimonas rosea]|uniref:Lipopolysaccharide transport system ATP-binding protein n=1 Tax=Armatimonas rosea TaxID=685828 RepID=A0A7W9W8Y8_ARMRO|nr:ABC transporter ATP-binding protein [Armatimonas rosea]MBB6052082.1 lipopolysaccharide transport system ATP-binding protein [Armatimonas rosea]
MSSSTRMLRVENLGKLYRIAPRGTRPGTLTENLLSALRGKQPPKEDFWAVRNLSFDVHQGEVVGLIGHNGAGKSTLLKLLSRITEPTEGEIALYGRVGSLLEVGTGFHPELTGRENVFMNGAILGMSRKEIESRFDEIIDFAGPRVALHLDSPVKRYSSGMTMRLGFAVAANLNPEILIVDEVLAVGDAEFQKKCLGKMQEVAGSGRTVFFVSHNLAAVTALCNRALLLHGGQLHEDGPVARVAATYQLMTRSGADLGGDLTHAQRSGSGAGRFLSLGVQPFAPDGTPQPLVYNGHAVQFELTVQAEQVLTDAAVTLWIADSNTYRLIDCSSALHGKLVRLEPGETARVRFTLGELLLKPGLYTLGVSLGRPEIEDFDTIEHAGTLEVAVDPDAAQATLTLPGAYTCRYKTELIPGSDVLLSPPADASGLQAA